MQFHYLALKDNLQSMLDITDLAQKFPYFHHMFLHLINERYLGNIHF